MTLIEAIKILADFASRYEENAGEAFSRRIKASDSNEACASLAEEAGEDLETAIELRDLCIALEVATKATP